MLKPTRRLTLEQLEDRLVLSTNLIMVTEVPGTSKYNLQVYTQQGTQVSSTSIPQAPGATESESVQGVTVDPSGNVDVFDGNAQPSLATLSASTNNWTFQTYSGWSSGGNLSYGEVAAYGNYVFASDMVGYQQPQNGIVRFSDSGGTPTLFGQGNNYEQLSLGQDGQIYGLNNNNGSHPPTVDVYNPNTLAFVKTITLTGGPDTDIRSVTADSSGNVYAATWGGYIVKYDSSGNYVTSIQPQDPGGGTENLLNIVMDTNGQIAVGTRGGTVYLTDTSLASYTTFATGQWNAFVTFDHYLGPTSSVTPSFSSLAGPTIPYGQSSVTLGGTISAGSTYPPGSVNITLNGVMQSATISSTDGSFSSTFDTSTLAANSYTVQYSYPGATGYNAISSSMTLTVSTVTPSFSSLAAPTITYGQSAVTLGGTISAGSSYPTGSVNITLDGVTKSATINTANGTFSASFTTTSLPVGSYTVQYDYPGSSNYNSLSSSTTLTDNYGIKPLYNTSKPIKPGKPLLFKMEVTNAAGSNLSSANLTVTAMQIVDAHGNTYTPKATGNANPGNVFALVPYHKKGFAYAYDLDTTGLTAGRYTLLIQVGSDPVQLALNFVVK